MGYISDRKGRKISITSVIFVFLLLQSAIGQAKNSSSLSQRFIRDVSDAYGGTVHVLGRPFQWHDKDWLTFGSIIAGTFTISLLDENIRRIFLRNRSRMGDRFSEIGEIYGEPISVLLITSSIYIFGLTLNDEWARKTAIILTSSLLPAGMIQTAAKISAGRARPYLEFGYAHFEPFRRVEDYYSFVSGHTLVAISTSLVLAKQIQNNFVKGFLYGLGSIGALARLYRDEHWFSDVLLGTALAISSVNTADGWITDKRKFAQRQVNWYILPHRNGLSLTVIW